MSACEKCWHDAGVTAQFSGESKADAYARLMAERKGIPCSPEDQAGPDGKRCPRCGRLTLHQWTGECMAGCGP